MAHPRAKILILGESAQAAADAARLLGDQYEVVVVPPGAAPPNDGAATLLLDQLGHGVCLVSPDGEVVWGNEKFRSFDDRTRARIAGACVEAASFFQQWNWRAGGSADATRGFEVSTPDNARIYEVLVSPAAGSEPGRPPSRVVAFVRDITTERRSRAKIDAIDQAGSELVRFDAESVRRLNVFERLKLLHTKIIKYCHDLLHFDHFLIRLVDERSGKLELVMATGVPQIATELDLYPLPEGNGISGYVAATGKSYICHDTEKDPRFLPGLDNARSSLTVPLRLQDRVIGVFNVESQQIGAFSEDDRQFAEIFGRYVAMALHMLDLLVVERSAVNEAVGGRVEGEIREPLEDLVRVGDWLADEARRDPEAAQYLTRIRADIDAIRNRIRNIAVGPQTLLGVERELLERKRDPLLEGRRVLIADDEARVRRIIHDVLHNRGCEVVACENGAVAIAVLDRVARGELPPFHAVLSDIKMPDKNGYEVFAASRKSQPGIPVILMTGFGYDPHHSIVRASQEGLQSVLFKPFQVERLLDEVRKAVTATPKAGASANAS